jgi:hypothetical protein
MNNSSKSKSLQIWLFRKWDEIVDWILLKYSEIQLKRNTSFFNPPNSMVVFTFLDMLKILKAY